MDKHWGINKQAARKIVARLHPVLQSWWQLSEASCGFHRWGPRHAALEVFGELAEKVQKNVQPTGNFADPRVLLQESRYRNE